MRVALSTQRTIVVCIANAEFSRTMRHMKHTDVLYMVWGSQRPQPRQTLVCHECKIIVLVAALAGSSSTKTLLPDIRGIMLDTLSKIDRTHRLLGSVRVGKVIMITYIAQLPQCSNRTKFISRDCALPRIEHRPVRLFQGNGTAD